MPKLPAWLVTFVTVCIIVTWLGLITVSAFNPHFTVPAELNAAVPVILAALYSASRGKKGDNEGDGSD